MLRIGEDKDERVPGFRWITKMRVTGHRLLRLSELSTPKKICPLRGHILIARLRRAI